MLAVTRSARAQPMPRAYDNAVIAVCAPKAFRAAATTWCVRVRDACRLIYGRTTPCAETGRSRHECHADDAGQRRAAERRIRRHGRRRSAFIRRARFGAADRLLAIRGASLP